MSELFVGAGYFMFLVVMIYLWVKVDKLERVQDRMCTWGQLFRGEPWKGERDE